MCFFFSKQKTAYEMRISDWSSDVCSSDLGAMRLAFRLEIATSGWAGQEVAADEADCAYISAAARLTSLAPTIELGEGGCLVGLLFRRQIPAVRITNLENAERKRKIGRAHV